MFAFLYKGNFKMAKLTKSTVAAVSKGKKEPVATPVKATTKIVSKAAAKTPVKAPVKAEVKAKPVETPKVKLNLKSNVNHVHSKRILLSSVNTTMSFALTCVI